MKQLENIGADDVIHLMMSSSVYVISLAGISLYSSADVSPVMHKKLQFPNPHSSQSTFLFGFGALSKSPCV